MKVPQATRRSGEPSTSYAHYDYDYYYGDQGYHAGQQQYLDPFQQWEDRQETYGVNRDKEDAKGVSDALEDDDYLTPDVTLGDDVQKTAAGRLARLKKRREALRQALAKNRRTLALNRDLTGFDPEALRELGFTGLGGGGGGTGYGSTGYGSTGYGSTGYGSTGLGSAGLGGRGAGYGSTGLDGLGHGGNLTPPKDRLSDYLKQDHDHDYDYDYDHDHGGVSYYYKKLPTVYDDHDKKSSYHDDGYYGMTSFSKDLFGGDYLDYETFALLFVGLGALAFVFVYQAITQNGRRRSIGSGSGAGSGARAGPGEVQDRLMDLLVNGERERERGGGRDGSRVATSEESNVVQMPTLPFIAYRKRDRKLDI